MGSQASQPGLAPLFLFSQHNCRLVCFYICLTSDSSVGSSVFFICLTHDLYVDGCMYVPPSDGPCYGLLDGLVGGPFVHLVFLLIPKMVNFLQIIIITIIIIQILHCWICWMCWMHIFGLPGLVPYLFHSDLSVGSSVFFFFLYLSHSLQFPSFRRCVLPRASISLCLCLCLSARPLPSIQIHSIVRIRVTLCNSPSLRLNVVVVSSIAISLAALRLRICLISRSSPSISTLLICIFVYRSFIAF